MQVQGPFWAQAVPPGPAFLPQSAPQFSGQYVWGPFLGLRHEYQCVVDWWCKRLEIINDFQLSLWFCTSECQSMCPMRRHCMNLLERGLENSICVCRALYAWVLDLEQKGQGQQLTEVPQSCNLTATLGNYLDCAISLCTCTRVHLWVCIWAHIHGAWLITERVSTCKISHN